MKKLELTENKMGVMPVPKLLITLSLPMIISMLVQALYNIVDSIFVAKINEEALTAVSLAFPIQNLMIAIAVGTGVGINTLLSRSLGEKNAREVQKAAQNGLFLSIMSYIVVATLGLLGSRLFFLVQTDNPAIVKYGTQYMLIVTVLSIGIFMQITLEKLLQSTGKTVYNMITQGTGAIVNIILDPILIFGLFGFPRLEVVGAAIATIIGQFVAVGMSLYYNFRKNAELNLSLKNFRPDRAVIREIYRVGIPSIIMQSIGSVMVFGMNKILLLFSSTATAFFGIYFKLQSFIFMPVFGLNNGMISIVAYNYGARNKKRIMDTIHLAVVIAVGIMLSGTIAFQLFPNQLLSLFDASDNMRKIGVPALRIISLSFVFAGYSIIIVSVFQALGNGVYSLLVSIARQLILILPLAVLFAKFFGLNTVWWSLPIAEIVCQILTFFLYKRIIRKKIVPLKQIEDTVNPTG